MVELRTWTSNYTPVLYMHVITLIDTLTPDADLSPDKYNFYSPHYIIVLVHTFYLLFYMH